MFRWLIALTGVVVVPPLHAYAVIDISWTNIGGYYHNAERTGGSVNDTIGILTTVPGVPGGDVFFQVVYAGPDGMPDSILPGGSVMSGGDDMVLFETSYATQYSAPPDGVVDATYFFNTQPIDLPQVADPGPGGFGTIFDIYIRIFEVRSQSEIVTGTYYYNGPVEEIRSINPGPAQSPGGPAFELPIPYEANRQAFDGVSDVLDLHVIPEPASILLLLVGAITGLAIRRWGLML